MYRRWLMSSKPGALHFLERERVEALWEEFGPEVTRRHAERWPFSRPSHFWRYSCRRDPRGWDESQYDYIAARPHLQTEKEKQRLRNQARARLRHAGAK